MKYKLINCKLHIEFNINKLNLLQDKIYYKFRKKNILKKIKKKVLANLIILKFNTLYMQWNKYLRFVHLIVCAMAPNPAGIVYV